ncbi:MAG: Dabb family protein [Microbacteriaceae bacterium]
MLRHIACIQFEPGFPEQSIEHFLQRLRELQSLVPDIIKLSAGRNTLQGDGRFDIGLTVDFADEAAYEQYNQHPEHLHVVALYKEHKTQIAVADYWI